MIIVAAFRKLKLMDIFAIEILSKCKNTRRVSLVFVLLTFFVAMLVTNDVALLTFVPLTILTFNVANIDCMKTIIIETLAVVLVCIVIMDRQLIKNVDYFLLLTFVCFFIFIGNISNIYMIQAV